MVDVGAAVELHTVDSALIFQLGCCPRVSADSGLGWVDMIATDDCIRCSWGSRACGFWGGCAVWHDPAIQLDTSAVTVKEALEEVGEGHGVCLLKKQICIATSRLQKKIASRETWF